MGRSATQREIAYTGFALLTLIGGFSLISNAWGG